MVGRRSLGSGQEYARADFGENRIEDGGRVGW